MDDEESTGASGETDPGGASHSPDGRVQTPLDVLQVNKLYYPVLGGIETVVRSLAEGLCQRDHRPRVLASVRRGRGGSGLVGPVPVHRTASLGVARSVPLSPTFPIALARHRRSADVVHHHLPNPLGVVSNLSLPRDETVTVATYHSDIVRQSAELRLYKPLLERFLARLDHVFVTSPPLLENSPLLQPIREKCSVVPLSIDVDEYATDTDGGGRGDGADVPVDVDGPLVLFVGRLNYYKGVEYLVEAMRSVDGHLLIVGDGDRRRSLEESVRTARLEESVTFLGHVEDGVLKRLYERAEVFVLPSVEPSEAFGVVQLEAMASGTPIVNTDLPTGVPWVSQHGETGLTVPPRNSEALAEALVELLGDDERRRCLGRNARKRVESRFGRDRMLSEVESVYTELLAR